MLLSEWLEIITSREILICPYLLEMLFVATKKPR
jgi:hypothetical protein